MITLLVLAYNEEENISQVISSLHKEFNEIIVVNDCSTDSTKDILEELSNKFNNLKIVNNKKNLGAGKSFETGVKEFLNSNSDFLVKTDGDGQFNDIDVLKIKKYLNEKKFDFIKCDRFWEKGIEGEIPLIRYFGNAFASLLIKFSTGNWKLNDPLNGLMGFSKDSLKEFKIIKKFNRYGYPFYVTTSIFYLSYLKSLKIGQLKNTVRYSNEKSNIKPLVLFFKLVSFSVANFYSKIARKLSHSDLQTSSLIDIISQIFIIISLFSIYKFFSIRYFGVDGPQGNWFLLFTLFIFAFFVLIYQSQKLEYDFSEDYVEDIF
tara:strand:- start:669 stop:1625 length:957 start_codon:yes stop_codon:yes gene_type:complete